MSENNSTNQPRDPSGQWATKPAPEAQVDLRAPYEVPRYTEPWVAFSSPYLKLINQTSTPNQTWPDVFADDEEFTYRVTGRMRDDVLSASGRAGEDLPVTLVTDDVESGSDATREQSFCIDVYVGEGAGRERVFSEYDSGPDSALAKFMRWLDT